MLSAVKDKNIPVVLKVGIKHQLIAREAEMLRFFENCGAVHLIDSCDGALLLQKCIPGYSLMDYFPNNEEKSIEIIANIIKKLHTVSQKQKKLCKIVSLKELLDELYVPSKIAKNYIEKSKKIAESLLKTTTENVICITTTLYTIVQRRLGKL